MSSRKGRNRGSAPEPSRSMRAMLLLGLLSIASAGCAGPTRAAETTLPFKLAIIPFSVEPISTSAAAVEESDAVSPRYETGEFERALESSLKIAFVDAIVLPWPAGVTPEEFRSWPQAKRDDHWIQASSKLGADLLLDCAVKAPRVVEPYRNDRFWMNLPLFLLGGPACYFVSDVTYEGEARLAATVHEVCSLQEGRATLSEGQAEVGRFDVRCGQVSLDFLDRASWHHYLLSIVLPSGFLAQDTSRARARVASELSRSLATELARQLRDSSTAITVADRLADFYLAPEVSVVSRGAEVLVRGEVVMKGAYGGEMSRYVVRYGSQTITGEFGAPRIDPVLSTDRDQFLRVPFAQELRREEGVGSLQLKLIQGGRDQIARTFSVSTSGIAASP